MSNRARALATEIAGELRDAVNAAHNKLVHLAYLHNPNASEGHALEQADRDMVEMLMFYVEHYRHTKPGV